jgi:hypothetical protein
MTDKYTVLDWLHEELIIEVLKYFDITTLYHKCKNISQPFKHLSNQLIHEKQSSILISFYPELLQSWFHLPLFFFNISYFQHQFTDFRTFIFYLTDFHEEFILVSKMEKMYYVKKLTPNHLLFLCDHDGNNIYYTIYFKRAIPFNRHMENAEHTQNTEVTNISTQINGVNLNQIPCSGYVLHRGDIRQENALRIRQVLGGTNDIIL